MKKRILAFICVVALLISGNSSITVSAEKRVGLSSKKITVKKGKSKILKVRNAKKKVKWEILSGKSYIILKKKGKVAVKIQGKKKGTAKVRAVTGKKKLTCNVVVKDVGNNNMTKPAEINSSVPSASNFPANTTEPVDTQMPPVVTRTPSYSLKDEQDVIALKELIHIQRGRGGEVNEDLDSRQYTWKDGKLIGIAWDYSGLSGNLDVSACVNLTNLFCANNQLSSLDVTKNVNLESLDCSCNKLSNLDVSRNVNLEKLYCDGNYLNSLDVTNNTKLSRLYCGDTVKVIGFHPSAGANQQDVNILKKLIAEQKERGATVSGDLDDWNEYIWEDGKLIEIGWNGRNLSGDLDVSGCVNLKKFYCGASGDDDGLSSLNISGCTNLTSLFCDGNQLSSLDLSKNVNLIYLYCRNNQLSSLDLSKNVNLEYLACDDNQLSNLDVSKNINLILLECWGNQLGSLDVSQNINLDWLHCGGNQLSSLDLSNNPKLRELMCDNNVTVIGYDK